MLPFLLRGLNFRDMSQQDVYPKMHEEQRKLLSAVDDIHANWESSKDKLGEMQSDLQKKLVAEWWNLADFLVMKYALPGWIIW